MRMLSRREVVAQVSGPDGQGRGILLNNLSRARIAQLFGIANNADDDEEASGDDDDDDAGWGGWGRARQQAPMQECWERCEAPLEAGAELRRGGEFGRPRVGTRIEGVQRSAFESGANMASKIHMRTSMRSRIPKSSLAVSGPLTRVYAALRSAVLTHSSRTSLSPACPTRTAPKWLRTAHAST